VISVIVIPFLKCSMLCGTTRLGRGQPNADFSETAIRAFQLFGCLGHQYFGQSSGLTPVEEPVGYDWTGFYIGAGGGWRWADFDIDTTSCEIGHVPECNFEGEGGVTYFDNTNEIYDLSLDDNGPFGTVQIGADLGIAPSFLIGVFASADFGSELEDHAFNQVNYDGFDNPDAGQAWSASIDSIFTVAARAGVTFDRALIYGLVGWSWGDAEASYFEGCDFSGDGGACDDIRVSNDDMVGGLTLGGGIEFLFGEHWSARLEYRHINFDDIHVHGVSGANDQFTADTETDITVQSVRGTINFRF
jgi:outer membrane immunogenic protein